EAAARASFIRRWKTTLEQRRDDYEQVESKADSLIKQKRFKDAARLWSDFREDTKKLETECPFAKDRYRTLLYDAAIAAGLKKCADEARAAWPLQEQEARGVAREGGYESAIKLLDGVIETTVDETLAAAKHLRDQLETEWASVTRRLEEDKAAATAAALAKARIAFAQEAQAARELVLKYDFKGALQKLKTLRESNTSEELRPRIERRVAEMERCARFKESLIAAIKNQGPSPSKFKSTVDPSLFGGL